MKRTSKLLRYSVRYLALILFPLLASGESYLSTHSHSDKDWQIVFSASISGKAFVNSGLALEILEVKCDNKLLVPTETYAHVHSDRTFFDWCVENIIYRIDPETLISYVWEKGKIVDGKIREYVIPHDVKVVVIRYRIHSADGKVSPQNIITSVEINQARLMGKDDGAVKPTIKGQ